MPAKQRGQVYKPGASWAIRYRGADGKRCQQAGFKTKSEAAEVLEQRLDELRLGPAPPS